MSGLVSAVGWVLAAALACGVWRLRARLELVAQAEHELRGPLTAFGLALHAARGTAAGRRLALVLDAEVARARAGLADLAAARAGERRPPGGMREPVRADALLRSSGAAWDAAARTRGRRIRVRSWGGPAMVRADRDRLAGALGNVMSNAVEHGAGDVSVSARQAGDRLRIEVTNETAHAGVEPGADPGFSTGAVFPPRPARDRGRGLDIAAAAMAESGGHLGFAVGPKRARTILDLPLER